MQTAEDGGDTEINDEKHTMPILAAETAAFPADLFEEATLEPSARCWWAVYTKSRQEKALARQLLHGEVPFYLPLVPKESLLRGRRIRSHVPLFAGYVFLFAQEEERVQALMTNRVSRILSITDQEGLYRDLRQIHHLIATDAPLTIERRLMPGQRVRVKSGAMMGLEGTILSRRGDCRLLVAVNFLQQGASVAIDDCMIERVDGDSFL